jgi:hypothetical protein
MAAFYPMLAQGIIGPGRKNSSSTSFSITTQYLVGGLGAEL